MIKVQANEPEVWLKQEFHDAPKGHKSLRVTKEVKELLDSYIYLSYIPNNLIEVKRPRNYKVQDLQFQHSFPFAEVVHARIAYCGLPKNKASPEIDALQLHFPVKTSKAIGFPHKDIHNDMREGCGLFHQTRLPQRLGDSNWYMTK